jgi:serine/threonine-protein kinase
LGQALLKQGRFAEAGQNTRRALDLLPARNPLRGFVTQQLQTCERMLALDEKLPALLKGDAQPADNQERFEYGLLCQIKKRYAAAAGFYTDAFAAEPKLAADLNAQHRYHAACAAALAGTGQGKDTAKLDDKDRARHRQQALTWLRADLAAWGKLLDKEPENARTSVEKMMQHWQQDADFARVRGDALAKLPEAERMQWRKLWDDVETLCKRAASAR